MINSESQVKNSLGKKISTRIVTGFFLIIPIAVTLWIAVFLYNILTDWSGFINELDAVSKLHDHIWGFETLVRLFSLLLILIVLFAIGAVGKYAVGRRTIHVFEKIIMKIPMLNIIYSTSQQLVDAVRNPGSGMFRNVVLFEYPRKGIFVIGFLTNENKKHCELKKKTGEQLISVFLPTTPNPTSGFLLFVPKDDCIYLDMSVSDAMRLIISGGAVSPPGPNNTVVIQQNEIELRNKEVLELLNKEKK